ncbi:hypothetical protein SDJN03_08083, partial [Cucurbita argyrosperma subsp. sororia]
MFRCCFSSSQVSAVGKEIPVKNPKPEKKSAAECKGAPIDGSSLNLFRSLSSSPSSRRNHPNRQISESMAGVSQASLVALIAIVFAVASVAATEAPAPSPASPATSIAPSFVSACVAAFVALAFGSTLRI